MKLRKLRMRPKRIRYYVGGGDYVRSQYWHYKGGVTESREWITAWYRSFRT